MEQFTPSPALRTSEADLSGRSNERKRCFRLENIRRYFRRTDKTYLLLCIFSSVMAVTALSSWAAKQGNGFAMDEITGQITGLGDYRRAAVQAGAALIGLVIAVLLSNIDYRSLVKVWPVHVALTWGMVLPTLVLRNVSIGPLTIGYNAGDTDNYSWYKLGGFTLQPTELAKISFILTFAMHLNNVRTRLNEPKELGKLLLHLAVPILIIHVQGDDGTAIIYAIIGCCMMFAAGLSWKYILGAVSAAAVAMATAFAFFSDKIGKGYQWYRILAVIDPDNKTGWAPSETIWKNIIYQQQRGEIALGSGGIFGNGLFGGSYYSVPNAHNDFILSWIGNAAGFVGCCVVLGVLFALVIKTFLTGARSEDLLGTFICAGIGGALLAQIAVNVGMNLRVLPVIGVTLPFYSAGGSSVLMLYICVGLVLSVYTHNTKKLFG
jgi:rod shape determining protein RodA